MKPKTILQNLVVVAVCILLLSKSAVPLLDPADRVRAYTRTIEFDYIRWTLNALLVKLTEAAVDSPRYLPTQRQHDLVNANIQLIDEINAVNGQIRRVYADPQVTDPEQATSAENELLEQLKDVEAHLRPSSETVLQQQVTTVLAEMGLTLGGQPVPPVLYHGTPLPMALIVSPRGVIQQDANISLIADLTLPEMVELEEQVEQGLDVSALVVPVGGVGVYPTMVMETTNLDWLIETVAHEWTHNYLTLRPLGLNYETTPALRTMNETAAAIAGTEIGRAVLERYYPERIAPVDPTPEENDSEEEQPPAEPDLPPPFDYRAEMHETRVTADQLLAEGKIEAAEEYMEARRRFFWENGYQIRRLNQAYFAFYGAYADLPGGAAGTDPVGPAVRLLRERSASLTEFIQRISWMDSYDDLLDALAKDAPPES